MNDIAKLAVDAYKGNVEKYSVREANEALYAALIEANNGKTSLDYKAIRDGKCVGLFAIIEEILANTVEEGLSEDMAFNALVDYRNVALGDSPKFIVDDNDLFVVDDVAEGTQGIRRQRLSSREFTLSTSWKAVRIYEELNRVLAGRVNFNEMIDKVGKSFRQQLLNDIYSAWVGVTAADLGGAVYFPTAGTYSEAALLDVIAHVEAAAGGKQATLLGTKKAIRNLTPSIIGETAKDDLYKMGYYGSFFGSPVVALPQRHKVGTTQFVLPDDSITIVAGADKPVKVVMEGDPLVIPGNPVNNADLTQEYFYGDRYGVGIVLAGNTGIGRYDFQ